MSLTVISTPIGNPDDITLRAIRSLKEAQALICEEKAPAGRLLKKLQIPEPPVWQLNEHSRPGDLKELIDLCRNQKVCLVSDCGTPGFCDPGAKLVDACLKEGIPVDVNPGASSLMSLISLSGYELKSFYFVGFLPAEKGDRERKLNELKNVSVPLVLMDTPYRLQSTLEGLVSNFGSRNGVLGIDLTGPAHAVLRDSIKHLAHKTLPKAPFVLLILPQ